MDFNKLRADFPIFKSHPQLIYFDNACTTQKPQCVVDAIVAYYTEHTACSGRSAHKMAKETDIKFEEARKKVAKFVGASENDVVWTKNTTESMNLVANSFDFKAFGRNKVVTTNLEHHSAILPFQLLAARGEISFDFAEADESGTIPDEEWNKKIDRNTALVVVHHSNNTLGTKSNLRHIIKVAHDNGALVLVDGAQGVPHCEVNFKREGYDFLAFSGHKMLGPTGIGCLIGRKELLAQLRPFAVGGGTIQNVKLPEGTTYLAPPQRFEAGIQHYAGAIGFGAAVDYLSKIGMRNVQLHEQVLASKLYDVLSSVGGIKIYGPQTAKDHGALFSFNLGKGKPHEVALMLDQFNIAVRSGLFCAQPAMEAMGAKDGAVRVSLYLYNTLAEIDSFEEKMKKIAQLYK